MIETDFEDFPEVTVTFARTASATFRPVAKNVSVRLPASKKIRAGTRSADALLLTATQIPPSGASLASVTVIVADSRA